MTEKDPEDMTASELLRHADSNPCSLCHMALRGDESCATTGCASWVYRIADKIDAEIEEARRAGQYSSSSVKPCLNLLAVDRGWPLIRDGEYVSEWMSRCFIPFPLYDNGEPVQLGEDGVSEVRFRRCYKLCSAHVVECTILDDDGEVLAVIEGGERVKRPAPEALGADGLPVKEGETVWDMASGLEIVVSRIAKDEGGNVIVCANGDICELQFAPKNITHTPPDTQERIDEDVRKEIVEYWDCVGVLCGDCPVKIDGKTPAQRYNAPGCETAKTLDLLRRQRELDARKGGE